MANANTNLLQININPAAKSVDAGARTSAKNSQLAQQSGNEKFSATLDKVSAKIEQQAQPEQPAAEIQPAASNSQAAAPQGQNDLAQDAPQILSNAQPALISKIIPAPDLEVPAPEIISQPVVELPAPENFSQPTVELPAPENISQPVVETPAPEIPVQPKTEKADAPEVEEVAPVQPVFVSANYFFTSNTETLLAPKAAEVPAATNLQTVLPQSGNSNSQSMLDLLGGKTWSAADVQASVSPQVQPVENLTPSAAPQVQQTEMPVAQTDSAPQLTQTSTPVQTQAARPQQMIFARFQPQFTQNFQPVENPAPQPEIISTPQVQTSAPVIQTSTPQVQNSMPIIQTPTPQIPQPVVENSAQPQIIPTPVIQTPTPQISQPVVENSAPQEIISTPRVQVQAPQISRAPQVPVQPQVQQTSTPQISELLGVKVSVEESAAPTAPVIQPQAQQQQQFSQPQNQQDAQTFQQTFAQVSTAGTQAAPEIPTAAADENSPAQNLTPPVLNTANTIQQPAAQIQSPDAAAQTPRDNFNVPEQIVQQARMIRTAENTEMVINLKPEHLGQLTLRISVSQNGAVNASFFSDNAQVRTIIENSLVQLRQELNDQGLKVENVQVYSGLSDGGLTNGQGQQAWQQNQQNHGGANRNANFSAFEEETDALTPTESAPTEGVDYKI